MSATEREPTFVDLGGVRLTRKAVGTIISALLLVPGGGQYALSSLGILDPGGAHRAASEQLAANVHLIELYERQLDAANERADRLEDRLQACHTAVTAEADIPASALEAIE